MKICYLTVAPVAALVVTAVGAIALAQQPEKPAKAPADAPTSAQLAPRLVYTCPMHPQVVQATPGTCPLCRMSLKAMKVVSVEESQETTNRETAPMNHKGMSMPGHEKMQGMQMEHGSMGHGMCGCGMCMMMMGMGNMEMNSMDGMNRGSESTAAKPAAARSYNSSRGGGRGCGC